MQVTFVKPTLGRLEDGDRFVDEARMEPLSLAVLAGLTPAGVDVRLFDDRIDEIDYDEPTDLVAINVETFTARRAYEIAAEYRNRRVPVVMGGMHASLLPDEVAEHADAVFLGDGESLWPQVVADAHEKRLRPRYDGAAGPPQRGTLPRRDLYAGKGYLPITLLQFGRGCRHRCEFCAVSTYFGHHCFTRPVEEVVAEIRAQPRRDLFFVDDNLIADPQAAKELLPRAHPAPRPLGLPGQRRPDTRPGADAAVRRERLSRQRDRFREPGHREPEADAEAPEPDRVRQVRRGGRGAAGPPPANLGRLRAGIRPRHARLGPRDLRVGDRQPSRSPHSTS